MPIATSHGCTITNTALLRPRAPRSGALFHRCQLRVMHVQYASAACGATQCTLPHVRAIAAHSRQSAQLERRGHRLL